LLLQGIYIQHMGAPKVFSISRPLHDNMRPSLCGDMLAGQMLHKNLRRCLLAPEKLRSELRSKGYAALADVFAIVLEPTGSFVVITHGALDAPGQWASTDVNASALLKPSTSSLLVAY